MPQIGETELDTRALSRALWRRSWLLILLAIAAGAGTYYLLGRVEPLYTADTSILMEERESPLTRARDEGPSQSSEFDESAIQSQVEVLRSREIADAVIDRLNLTRRPEFDPAARPSLVSSLLVMLGLETPPTSASVRQRVMESYYERLSVYPVQKSRVIAVEAVAPSPDLAADVANAVAEAFVDLQQDAKRQSAVAATAWLEQEIERLRERVAEAEQAVATYRSGNQLFNVGGSGAERGTQGGNLSTQQLSDLNAELARARAARAESEARAELVQTLLSEAGSLESFQEVLDSPLIQRLLERQVALRAQIVELSTTYLPGHPRLRSLQGQLGNLEAQIRQEAQKTLTALNTAARVAAAREESLVASLDQAKVAVSESNEQEIELRALEREAAAQRDLLESFLARYREAVARTDADYLPADARIISRAVAPRDPSYPKKAMMSVAAAVAMLLIAGAFVLLREFTSGRAFRIIGYGPAAVSGAGQELSLTAGNRQVLAVSGPDAGGAAQPALGPGADWAAAVAAAERDEDRAAEAAPDLPPATDADAQPGTAELAEIIASPGVRMILFAGAEGGEGAGEIAFAAAKLAAGETGRLLLLDVGLTPSRSLGGGERPGLGDLLGGEAAFGEVIRRDESSRVHWIPMGATENNPPLQRLQIVIGALTHTYEKVIVVADRLSDWPDEHVVPDLAAIICRPETGETARAELTEGVLTRGARRVMIVRYLNDGSGDAPKESEAA